MNFLKKWFARMSYEGRELLEEDAENAPIALNGRIRALNKISAGTIERTSPNTHSINFQIYPATGGYVVEISFYDEKSDRTARALHVVPGTDFNELGESISKIITIEMLKR